MNSKGPLLLSLEEAHRKRKDARALHLRGPIYKSLEEARRANVPTPVVHHKIEAMGDKMFARIPELD